MQTQADQLKALFMPGDTVTNAAMENVQNGVPLGYGADYMNGGNLGATVTLAAERGLGALGVVGKKKNAGIRSYQGREW